MKSNLNLPPDLPSIRIESYRRRRLSAIWIVPLVAFLIGVGLTYRHYSQLGPEITIAFKSADGLAAKATKIKYKDVVIGEVTQIELQSDLSQVVVTARMVKPALPWLTEKSRFWVVRPQATLRGVSGLDTLLSGTYIQAEVVLEGNYKRDYIGLDTPPQTAADAPGLRLRLKAQQAGSVSVGAPIYFRQLPVGQVETRYFSPEQQQVEFDIFIHAPFHEQISDRSRFWNASGFQATISSDGVKLGTESVEALLAGGIAFDHLASERGGAVAAGHTFTLFANEAAAREQRYAEQVRTRLRYQLYFSESVRGLSIGAPVEYLGVPVGQVVEVNLRYDPTQFQAYIPVVIELEPERLGLSGTLDYVALLQGAIDRGLHAQLQSGNLLTGQLLIALQQQPNPAARWRPLESPLPQIPTLPSALALLSEKANGALDQLMQLPIGELGRELQQTVKQANRLLAAAEGLLNAPETQTIAPQLRQTLKTLEQSLAQIAPLLQQSQKLLATTDTTLQAVQPVFTGLQPNGALYYELTTALKSLDASARSVERLMTTLERNPKALLGGN